MFEVMTYFLKHTLRHYKHKLLLDTVLDINLNDVEARVTPQRGLRKRLELS